VRQKHEEVIEKEKVHAVSDGKRAPVDISPFYKAIEHTEGHNANDRQFFLFHYQHMQCDCSGL